MPDTEGTIPESRDRGQGVRDTIVRLLGQLESDMERGAGVRWTQNELRAFLTGSRAEEAERLCSGNKELLDSLKGFLTSGSWASQRAWAAGFISRFEEPEVAVKVLMKSMEAHDYHRMLDAKNWTLRYLGDAAFQLRKKMEKEGKRKKLEEPYEDSVEFLLEHLDKEEANDTRHYIIEALGALACRRALPRLIDILDRDYVDVQISAARAIGAIGSTEGPDLMPGGEMKLEEERHRVVWENALEGLEKAARHDEPRLASAAMQSMASIGGREAFNQLRGVLAEQPDKLMRGLAANAIANLRDFSDAEYKWDRNLFLGQVIYKLAQLLSDEGLEFELLWALERLIGRVKDEDQQVNCLVDLIIESEDERVWPKLTNLARRMHYEDCLAKLQDLAQEGRGVDRSQGDARQRQRASEAIIEMGGPLVVDSLRIQRELLKPIQQGANTAADLLKNNQQNLQQSFNMVQMASRGLVIFGGVLLGTAFIMALVRDIWGTGETAYLLGGGGFLSLVTAYVTHFINKPTKDLQKAASYAAKVQVPVLHYMSTYSEVLLHFQDLYRNKSLTMADIDRINQMLSQAAKSTLEHLTAVERELGEEEPSEESGGEEQVSKET
ncbi:MAG: HEAT repeat domain-containing protein [Anaerolineae bacterium]|nr:HEAT repeat domain-containing protein [Anaerolineae bacterium]